MHVMHELQQHDIKNYTQLLIWITCQGSGLWGSIYGAINNWTDVLFFNCIPDYISPIINYLTAKILPAQTKIFLFEFYEFISVSIRIFWRL